MPFTPSAGKLTTTTFPESDSHKTYELCTSDRQATSHSDHRFADSDVPARLNVTFNLPQKSDENEISPRRAATAKILNRKSKRSL